MEGRVYVCSWKQTPAGFSVWVKARPAIRAEAASFAAADEALWGEIISAYNDGESVRVYDPPEPVDPKLAEYLSPRLVYVVGNDWVRASNPDELYEGGVCRDCGNPRGPRTTARAVVADIESGSDGGFIHTFRFFSEAFVNLLTSNEREAFEWRPIDRPGRTRKLFFELILKRSISLVGVRGLKCEVVICRACSYRPGIVVKSPELPDNFICRDDLPRAVPSCFGVAGFTHGEIAFSFDRWCAMVGKPGARLLAFDLGVVGSDRCERDAPTRYRR